MRCQRNERGIASIDVIIFMAIFVLVAIMGVQFLAVGETKEKLETTKVDSPPAAPEASGDGGQTLLLVLGVLGAIALLGLIIGGTVVAVKRVRAQQASAAALAARWATVEGKYDSVRLEWGGLAADPLAILEHSRLLDVAFGPTAAFLDSFSLLQDRIGVLQASGRRLQAGEVTEMEELTAKVHRSWAAAKTAAERASYAWLPKREQGYAATAANLLRLAANEGASVSERATAAEKAAGLLRRIEAVTLPAPLLAALEAPTYLALEARP